MSGLEVAGLVLGTIPLIVTGLEYYMKGLGTLQSFRSYKRTLQSLIISFKTEHAILQNICEKVLVGIASQTRIEEMIANPFGDLWREEELSDKLRLRLWSSFKVFEERVQDMREAMEEMTKKLNMEANGRVEWTDSTPMKKQLKRAKFILQQSFYSEIMTRIRDGVSALESLARLDAELEQDRKSRSQGRINNLINKMSKSIYQTLRSAITCQCPKQHEVGLRLSPPSRTVLPEDQDDDIIRKLKFYVAISNVMGNHLGGAFGQWSQVLLQVNEDLKVDTAPTMVKQEAVASKKSVKFSFTSSTHNSSGSLATKTSIISQSTSSSLTLNAVPSFGNSGQRRRIENLCDELRRSGKSKREEECGHIQDFSASNSRKYGVFVLEDPDDENWTLVPLHDILKGSGLLYRDKLRLAWAVACSALQIYATPWMSNVPSSNDIYIVQQHGRSHYQNIYVQKRFPETVQPSPGTQAPNDLYLLSLGILLIEVILGKSMESLRPSRDVDTGNGVTKHVLDYETASGLLGRVRTAGGSRYCNAVELCLRCDMSPLDSTSEHAVFENKALAGVINLIEQDLKASVS